MPDIAALLADIDAILKDTRVYGGVIASLVGAAFYLMVRAEWPSSRPNEPSSQVLTPVRLSLLISLAIVIGIIGTGIMTGKFDGPGDSAPSDGATAFNSRDLLIIATFGYVGLDTPTIFLRLFTFPAALGNWLKDLAEKWGAPSSDPTMALLETNLGDLKVTRHWVPRAPSEQEPAGKAPLAQRSASASPSRPTTRPPARSGRPLRSVRQIVVGDTGRPGLSAAAAGNDLGQAYGHFLIDDRHIIECVPAITSRTGWMEHAYYLTPTPSFGEPGEGPIFVNLCFGDRIERALARQRWAKFVALLRIRFLPRDGIGLASSHGGRRDPAQALAWAGQTIEEFLAAIAAEETAIRAQLAKPTHDQPRPRST